MRLLYTAERHGVARGDGRDRLEHHEENAGAEAVAWEHHERRCDVLVVAQLQLDLVDLASRADGHVQRGAPRDCEQ